jgi:hypothetical protein
LTNAILTNAHSRKDKCNKSKLVGRSFLWSLGFIVRYTNGVAIKADLSLKDWAAKLKTESKKDCDIAEEAISVASTKMHLVESEMLLLDSA